MLLFILFVFHLSFQQTIKWKLVQSQFDTHDAVISAVDVSDNGADPTGKTDQRALFQVLVSFNLSQMFLFSVVWMF
jgi:hypothetical protein